MRLRPALSRATAYVRWARELATLGASRCASAWLFAASIVSLAKVRVPVLRDRIWTVDVRLGSRRVDFRFRDRSELRALGEVFVGDEYALLPEVRVATVLDLGANAGQASLFFRMRFPEARVLAVEPDPRTFELLRRNVGADPAVDLLNCAVTAAPGPVSVRHEALSWASTVEPASVAEPGATVEGRTLDQLIEAAGGAVDLVKMDIEGLEHDVLMASSRLKDVPLVIGELHYRSLAVPADEALAMWQRHGEFASASRVRPHLFLLSR